MQPTPTRSPTPVARDRRPRVDADADDLVARHERLGLGPQSPRTVWMSEWQMPACVTSISTSLGPTSRRSMMAGARGSETAGAA